MQEQRADSNDYGMTEELRCLCFYILESDRKFELLGLECKDGGGEGEEAQFIGVRFQVKTCLLLLVN